MKYLSIVIWSCYFLPVFSQNSSTVTLVFVSSTHDSYKNYEAVIDDVSYYSENTSTNGESSNGKMPGSRNTIWLNNFQPGKHTIEVYSVRNGSDNERTGNTPLYSSTFTVKEGFDAKIAVRSNGQVQFSERISTGNNNSGNVFESDSNIHSSGNSTTADKKMDADKNDNTDNKMSDVDRSTVNNDDSFNNGNTSTNGRHSRKRIDTAIVENDEQNNTINTDINNAETGNDKRNSNDGFNNNGTNKAPMDDNQFKQLYETIRNQWLPGQKMKTISNEFLNAEDNFTTSQAKKLILLVNEEGNRLKLAKSSYQCITDPEKFSEIDDVLRYKASKDELDDFVSEGGRD